MEDNTKLLKEIQKEVRDLAASSEKIALSLQHSQEIAVKDREMYQKNHELVCSQLQLKIREIEFKILLASQSHLNDDDSSKEINPSSDE